MCDYLAKKNFKCQYVQKISINYKIYGNNADEKCYENVTKDVFHKKKCFDWQNQFHKYNCKRTKNIDLKWEV